MTETEKQKADMRFVAEGEGLKIERPNPLPDWDKVLKEAEKEQASD